MNSKKILYLGLDPSRLYPPGICQHIPLIRIIKRPFDPQMCASFEKLHLSTYVLLTSRTAANIFFAYAKQIDIAHLDLLNMCYFCVGGATAGYVEARGVRNILVPRIETAEGLVELLSTFNFEGAHLFFPHSSLARKVISNYLRKKSISFTSVPIYDTVTNYIEIPRSDLFEKIVFTSPSTVRAYIEIAGELPPQEKCVAIGSITQMELAKFF